MLFSRKIDIEYLDVKSYIGACLYRELNFTDYPRDAVWVAVNHSRPIGGFSSQFRWSHDQIDHEEPYI